MFLTVQLKACNSEENPCKACHAGCSTSLSMEAMLIMKLINVFACVCSLSYSNKLIQYNFDNDYCIVYSIFSCLNKDIKFYN